MMELSEDTVAVLEFLEASADGGLRKRNDIGNLLEIAASRGDYQIINQIVFTGKSVYNLYTKLKKVSGSNTEILQKQLAISADELKILLDKALPEELIDVRERFDVTYFANTSGCLANLVDLSYDLTILKNAQSRKIQPRGENNDKLQ